MLVLGYAQDVHSRVLRPVPPDPTGGPVALRKTRGTSSFYELADSRGGVALGVPPTGIEPVGGQIRGDLRLRRAYRPFAYPRGVDGGISCSPAGLTRGPLADRQCRARSRRGLGGALTREETRGASGGVYEIHSYVRATSVFHPRSDDGVTSLRTVVLVGERTAALLRASWLFYVANLFLFRKVSELK